LDNPPYFARGGDIDAVAEFTAFVTAVGDEAAFLLAELAVLHNHFYRGDIADQDRYATRARGLYCRQVADWAVFYTVRARIFGVTVVHVGNLKPHRTSALDPDLFSALESEAATRLNRLGLW
jgi:hypothetical protein